MNTWGYSEPYADSHALRREHLTQLDAYLEGIADLAEAARPTRWVPDYANEGAYRASLEPLRQQLRERLGYPPPGREPTGNAEWQVIHETDAVRIHRVFVPVRQGLDCYGLYFEHIGATTPLPLLICMHGGGGFPELPANFEHPGNYGHMIERAFGAGYAVWAPYAIFPDHWSDLPPEQRRRSLDARAKLVGTSLAAIDVFRITAGLDAILARPDVDEERVGMVGLSYGGYHTLFTTALEERIQAAVSSCYFNNRRTILRRGIENDGFLDWHFTNLLGEIADEELVALVCPRPLVIEVGERDELFPVEGARTAFERAKAHYERLGVGSRIQLDVFDGGHEFNGIRGFEMLNGVLKPDAGGVG